MKIASSSVQMASSHRSEMTASVSESLTVWNNRANNENQVRSIADAVRISASQSASFLSAARTGETGDAVYEISEEDQMKIRLIEEFIKRLTGKDFKITVPDKVTVENSGAARGNGAPASQSPSSQAPASQGWGLIYSKTVSATKSEQTAFAATAYIKTQDGRELSALITLQLKSSSAAAENTTIRLGDAKAVDPLVMNLSADSATVTANKFSFDLNADGKNEEISFVGPGSGLLALDKNGDGIINNGSELFGPMSGNGFNDLAAYDQDRNQWIDENDSIFNQLQIWIKGDDGKDKLFALGTQGIGAIYLGNVSTPFSLESAGSLAATIQRTGIYLRENGTAGTMQHVDMVV